MNALTIEAVNAMDEASFVAALGGLFEGSPWIAFSTWQGRPFFSRAQLHQALCSTMYDASAEQQLALIRAHPDLAGRVALAGQLGAESQQEQAAAGLVGLSPADLDRFTHLNQLYRSKFGFPFVICARLNAKDRILHSFEQRLANEREQEIRTALDEIAKIAALRLADIVVAEGPEDH